jgi:hypothetical protein
VTRIEQLIEMEEVLMCSKFKAAFITRVDHFFLSLDQLLSMPNSTFMIHGSTGFSYEQWISP